MLFQGKEYKVGDKILVPCLYGFHEMEVTEVGASNEKFNAAFIDGEVLAIVSREIFDEF